MALGLHIFHTTKKDFLAQLDRFDSVTLNENGEFACWLEGSCNFYVIDGVSNAELQQFADSVAEQHAAKQIEKICESCGSNRTTKSEHSIKCECGHKWGM